MGCAVVGKALGERLGEIGLEAAGELVKGLGVEPGEVVAHGVRVRGDGRWGSERGHQAALPSRRSDMVWANSTHCLPWCCSEVRPWGVIP